MLSDVILENESQFPRISNYLRLKVTPKCCEISISENVNIPYPSVVTTKKLCTRDSLMSESSFLFGQTEYKRADFNKVNSQLSTFPSVTDIHTQASVGALLILNILKSPVMAK